MSLKVYTFLVFKAIRNLYFFEKIPKIKHFLLISRKRAGFFLLQLLRGYRRCVSYENIF